MPSSGFNLIPQIIESVNILKPSSILDVGCGNGKYGFLCHEALYFWNNICPTIDAIEGYPNYIGKLQREIYNKIYIGEALSILKTIPDNSYDLVLAVEILEHFSKTEGIEFLQYLKRVGRNVILSCPKITKPQDAINDNSYEIHRSQWRQKDFGECVVLPNKYSLIIVIGPDRNKIKTEKVKKSIISKLMEIKSYVLQHRGLLEE